MTACPLCDTDGGRLLARGDGWRIVFAEDSDIGGFTRVICDTHVAEMTDLAPGARDALMRVVFEVEALMREHLGCDKINLASLGNQVPHVHWHLIPRWRDDAWFPSPVWAAPVRPARAADDAALAGLEAAVRRRFGSAG